MRQSWKLTDQYHYQWHMTDKQSCLTYTMCSCNATLARWLELQLHNLVPPTSMFIIPIAYLYAI